MLRFLLQKELRQSDVGNLGRVVLPKRASEAFLPNLASKEGILISMDDIDGLRIWNFKYRYWPNNNSRMYVLENTGDFVRTHELQTGDYLMLYKDDQNQKYVIRGRKSFDLNVCCDTKMFLDSGVQIAPDFEVNKQNYFDVNYPMIDDMDMQFSFNNPFPDLNGDISMNFPSYSSLGTINSFGSFDNFSLDDF
ncbi:B3 domain transcription factor [Thalictrum thalictroides]|uniref:B3 domain transcription factor n=1 Tax=Thalictrum thalictroides TaxID=46969 RepID=A0A7J6XFI5_THATH|nr:B3 domain transcription factor [Thalictrum thalictroides]